MKPRPGLLVVDVPGLTLALATRSDLTPNLADLIAFGAFAAVSPGGEPMEAALFGRCELRRVPTDGGGSPRPDEARRLLSAGGLALTLAVLPGLHPVPADPEEAMRLTDRRIGGLVEAARAAGARIVVTSNAEGSPGVLITSFEARLPDPMAAADVPRTLLTWL